MYALSVGLVDRVKNCSPEAALEEFKSALSQMKSVSLDRNLRFSSPELRNAELLRSSAKDCPKDFKLDLKENSETYEADLERTKTNSITAGEQYRRSRDGTKFEQDIGRLREEVNRKSNASIHAAYDKARKSGENHRNNPVALSGILAALNGFNDIILSAGEKTFNGLVEYFFKVIDFVAGAFEFISDVVISAVYGVVNFIRSLFLRIER